MKNLIATASTTAVCFALAILVALPATAQVPDDHPAADPADVESVDAIIAAVYDVISGPAGQERDWDRFKSLFRPDAKIIPSGMRQDGQLYIRYMGLQEYVDVANPQFLSAGFFEVEIFRVQEEYGQIVHLFSTYESRRNADDEKPFTRGINSFQLINDGNRWWVVNIFFQGESPSAPIPAKYLPKG